MAAIFLIAIAALCLLPERNDQKSSSNNSTTASPEGNNFFDKKSYRNKAVVLAASPDSSQTGSKESWEQVQEENPVDASFYEALEKFTFRTASSFLQAENFLYSPLSLYYALAITAEGAAGETQRELLGLLSVPEAETLAEQCGNLYRRLYQDGQSKTFQIANSLWMAEKLMGGPVRWQERYLNCAANDFYASIFSVDFGDETTYQYMSHWVSDHTGGLLEPNLEPEPPLEEASGGMSEQILGILNTIYLKDRWKDSFYEEFTREEAFYPADGTAIQTPFMCQEISGDFFTGDGFVRAELGLEQLGSMVFVLPDEGVSPEEFFESPERLKEAFQSGSKHSGEISWRIPKFTFGMTQKLEELLKQLGVKKAFAAGEADFSSMFDGASRISDVWISQVSQGVRLVVEEGGIEAAAYTYVAMNEEAGVESGKEHIEMTLNRPFLYGILYDGVYTFLGVCGNPALEE